MRLIPALVLSSLAGAAHAGSVDAIKGLPKGTAVDSIIRIGCTDCPPPEPRKDAYAVPALKPGEQKVELKLVNGEQKIFRTDAWAGGSPVTFVSLATKEDIAALGNPPGNQALKGDGIDMTSTTAAVDAVRIEDKPMTPVSADMGGTPPAPKPLDTSSFTLRAD